MAQDNFLTEQFNKPCPTTQNRNWQSGFTLVELMIVIAIAGILSSIAVPAYQSMIERNKLREVVEGFKSDLMFAKIEAIKMSKDVAVSRSTGNSGNWCYGLTTDIPEPPPVPRCDCNSDASEDDYCNIKRVLGNSFSSIVNMDSTNASSTFDFRRGTIGANGVTFSTTSYAARVVFSSIGRVRICIPDKDDIPDKVGLPNYPECN